MKRFLSVFALFIIVAVGCKKDDEIIATAGKGGKAIVRVKPLYNNQGIDSCVVYVSYNTNEPGLPNDSAVQRLNNTEAIGTFPGLRYGHYYFQVLGYDTMAKVRLRGGMAYEVSAEDSSVNLEVPVAVW